MFVIAKYCRPCVLVGEEDSDTADHVKVLQGGYADHTAFVAGEVSRQDSDAILGAFVVESGFHHGICVLFQGSVDRHTLERKVLLGEEAACEYEAARKRVRCFFIRLRDYFEMQKYIKILNKLAQRLAPLLAHHVVAHEARKSNVSKSFFFLLSKLRSIIHLHILISLLKDVVVLDFVFQP